MTDIEAIQSDRVQEYLAGFAFAEGLTNPELWAEMDRVWDAMGLDDSRARSVERFVQFYSHPVWILNGLFSETDPTSHDHRVSLAEYVALQLREFSGPCRVADFGGGSGVLAKLIGEKLPMSRIDVVEPHPFEYFVERLNGQLNVRFERELMPDRYHVVIAQDVLEHLESPVSVALECVRSLRPGGYAIFANNFWPVIKCHLPSTFYLRHTFTWVLRSDALVPIGVVPGAEHAMVFKRIGPIDESVVRRRERVAKLWGPLRNKPGETRMTISKMLRSMGLRR